MFRHSLALIPALSSRLLMRLPRMVKPSMVTSSAVIRHDFTLLLPIDHCTVMTDQYHGLLNGDRSLLDFAVHMDGITGCGTCQALPSSSVHSPAWCCHDAARIASPDLYAKASTRNAYATERRSRLQCLRARCSQSTSSPPLAFTAIVAIRLAWQRLLHHRAWDFGNHDPSHRLLWWHRSAPQDAHDHTRTKPAT